MKKLERDRAPSPLNPWDSATRQDVCHEGPPTRSRWRGYHLARPGGPVAEERLVPETSNLKPQTTTGTCFCESCRSRKEDYSPCICCTHILGKTHRISVGEEPCTNA